MTTTETSTAPRRTRNHRRPDSREAILEAATAEFVERGFHGARMERVAERAGFNKSLVYRYYGDRDGLLRAVLGRHLARREAVLQKAPDSLPEALRVWFRESASPLSSDFVKLLQHEALTSTDIPVVEQSRRRRYYGAQIQVLREWQRQGRINNAFEARFLFLALLALVVFPVCFPQLTWLATGLKPTGRRFMRGWYGLLKQFGRMVESG